MVFVNNYYGVARSYLPVAINLAQHSTCSVIFFDDMKNVIYFNNRLGTFDKAKKIDTVNVDNMCRYVMGEYSCGRMIPDALNRCYNDLQTRAFSCFKLSGEEVNIKIIPVVESVKLVAVILMARLSALVIGNENSLENS
jgi:hypothetical protein